MERDTILCIGARKFLDERPNRRAVIFVGSVLDDHADPNDTDVYLVGGVTFLPFDDESLLNRCLGEAAGGDFPPAQILGTVHSRSKDPNGVVSDLVKWSGDRNYGTFIVTSDDELKVNPT